MDVSGSPKGVQGIPCDIRGIEGAFFRVSGKFGSPMRSQRPFRGPHKIPGRLQGILRVFQDFSRRLRGVSGVLIGGFKCVSVSLRFQGF